MDQLELLDYYTLLELRDDATPEEIRDAFHRFALRFHPDRHIGAPVEKIERATHIYARGAEAYRALIDPELRKRYDVLLARGHLRLPFDDK